MNNGQTYEMGYLALSDLSSKDVENLQSTLAGIVEQAGGQVVSHGDVHFIDLAYTMIKKVGSKNYRHDQAYFSWLKFNSSTDAVETIKHSAESQKEMLRMMVVKTVSDDSLTDVFSVEQEEDSAHTDTPEGTEDKAVTDEKAEPQDVSDEEVSQVVASDDLTLIEGIGPVIAQTLANAGITSFEDLAKAEVDTIHEAITGVRGNHDAGTWAQQAALARDGKFDELEALKKELDGGRA